MFDAVLGDAVTVDLLLTIWASACLLGLWVASAFVLPWTDKELEEVDVALASLMTARLPRPQPAPVPVAVGLRRRVPTP
ncbi:MAG: hypothetical protein H6739_08390 [Alphaproteobacteria bacterium]|nr:hypothetical protein [Alphaproteobacteria bacterium]